MARKRMFDLEIINQDSFFDLPMDTKALYFLLGMEADDEGFVSPKKVLRLYGGTEDSLKVLIAKEYIIPFETGVIVITDWKRNNYIDKNKSKPTIYQQEKAQISYDESTQKYVSLEKVKLKLNESLEKVYTDKNRIDKNRIEYKERNIKERKIFKKPTLEEIENYIKEKNMIVNAKTFYDYFETSNWVDSKGNKVKNWKLKLITWNSYGKDKKEEPIWFDKNIEKEEMTESEKEELENLLNDM